MCEKKEYAVKCFNKNKQEKSEDYVRRKKKLNFFKNFFFHEVEILRELKHPNIINLRECFEGDTSYYMILDLMNGNTLSNYLKKKHYRNPLP